jgi:N,N'-diacetylchitobiose phosphorylase
MQYGHFDDAAKEYVIDRPDTPRPWSNYLGSTEYGAIITNCAGGYSFYTSAAQGRFTRLMFNNVPADQPGRYFYIRDNASGDYWSASWQPVGKPLDDYRSTCRHGTAYTAIESEYAGIRSESTYFVPLARTFEVWLLQLTNTTDAPRDLSVFTFLEYSNEWVIQQDLLNLQYTQYIARTQVVDGMIEQSVCGSLPADPGNFQNRDQGRWTFFGVVGADVAGYDSDREAFIGGPYRTYANPVVVERGECTGSTAYGDNACATAQVNVRLEPGETREFMVVMGVGKTSDAGRAALAEFDSTDKARAALDELKAWWHGRLGALVCHTPDAEFDSMINVWNAYNCLITFAWSRAASLVYAGARDGLGYRDTVQDFLGAMTLIPDEVRKRLELMITGQAATGGAMSVVKPWDHHPGREQTPQHYRADDCLWLFNAVPAYVKETGDIAFYDRVLPYADQGEDTVLGHLRRAIEFNLERTGAHGLPCGLEADWNDCLRMGEKGESVFVTFQLRLALTVYSEVCERLDRPDEARWTCDRLAELDQRIQAHCWDGEWFVRAFQQDGTVVGTKDADEGRIFLNAQSWAVLSGAATPDQADRCMHSVNEHLATPYGLMTCTPPYEHVPCREIRAVLFNPGLKENGGIFSHTQGWAIMAEATLGHRNRAYEYCRAYMPAAYNTRAEVREIEPYVHCQSTHTRHSPKEGVSRVPWLSGTASWSYYSATQYILGIRPDYDGLRLGPCLPADWQEITVDRRFRGRDFRITIRNGETGKGVRRLVLNGEELEGDLLPDQACRDSNDVEVQLA